MKKQKVLIVVSNYYKEIADGLIKGATKYLDSRKDKEVFVGYGIDLEYAYRLGKKYPHRYQRLKDSTCFLSQSRVSPFSDWERCNQIEVPMRMNR